MQTDQVCPSARLARNSRDAVRSWKRHGLRSLLDEFWEHRVCVKKMTIQGLVPQLELICKVDWMTVPCSILITKIYLCFLRRICLGFYHHAVIFRSEIGGDNSLVTGLNYGNQQSWLALVTGIMTCFSIMMLSYCVFVSTSSTIMPVPDFNA